MGIEDIYKMLINGLELNNITLESYGFTNDDIDKLIMNKQIRIEDGKYNLVSVKKFFSYGIRLLRDRNLSSANACFYKCYELNKNIKEICLQVLTLELKRQKNLENKNFNKAFNIFLELESINSRKNDNDLYLYLFSFILEEMPSDYKDKVSNVNINNLMLEDTCNNKDENEIRKAIINRKFKYAIKLLDVLIKKQNNYPVRYETLRSLLNEVINAENRFNNKLLLLAKNSNYKEIFDILEDRKKIIRLSVTEENILLIVRAILNIIGTKGISVVTKINANNLYKIIYNNDFKSAFILVNNYLEKYNFNKDNNIIYVLLFKINELIFNINNKEISDMQDIAYYISSNNMSVEEAKKILGITPKVCLLVKLIYVRDYYIEGKYKEGDKLIEEIEFSKGIYEEVDNLKEELKRNRNKYIEELDILIKEKKKEYI